MRAKASYRSLGTAASHWWTTLVVLLGLLMAGPAAADIAVNVNDDAGNPITNGFRWLLELDNSYGIKKTAPDATGPWAGPAGGVPVPLPGHPEPERAVRFDAGRRQPELHALRQHPPQPRADRVRRRHQPGCGGDHGHGRGVGDHRCRQLSGLRFDEELRPVRAAMAHLQRYRRRLHHPEPADRLPA